MSIEEALSKVERPIVFYHDACITHDGWVSALLAKLRWPDAELVPVQYGDAPWWRDPEAMEPHDVLGRDVLVVDFSFKRGDTLELRDLARSVHVFDHHRTAAAELAGLDCCVFDMNRSGAGLALDYFFPGARRNQLAGLDRCVSGVGSRNLESGLDWPWPLSRAVVDLALLIEDYDLWRFSDPRTRAVGIFLETIPHDVERWHSVLWSMSLDDMAKQGESLLAYRGILVGSLARNAYEVEWPEGKILAVNSAIFKNEIADAILRRVPMEQFGERHAEIPEAPAPLRAVVTWYRDEHAKIVCSLRTHPEGADASVIAKRFGGGGHARSAGFTISAFDQRVETLGLRA